MQENTTMLVLGAGVAGMKTALNLAAESITVHVVEKDKRIGGLSERWSCMATDSCHFCSACLVSELEQKFLSNENIILHKSSRLSKADRNEAGFSVEIAGETSKQIQVAKIIVASGVTPYDPSELESLHYQQFKNVITTAELNDILREERLSEYVNFAENIRVGFLQCVGSRDQTRGRDYCSQVCCKTAIRHANKLSSIFPKSEISIFHMDLQRIGKQVRSLVNGLNKKVKLLQGVPAEILQAEDGKSLKIFREDEKTGQRVAAEFDLLVLSVGMLPSTELEEITKVLEIEPNGWGFLGGVEVKLPDNILSAGAANGPTDMLGAMAQAEMASAKALEDLKNFAELKQNKRIAVIGGGFEAQKCAETLANNGFSVLGLHCQSAPESHQKIEWLANSSLIAVDGQSDKYTVTLKVGDSYKTEEVTEIVVANSIERASSNIWPEFGDKVKNLKELKDVKDSELPETISFLLDYHGAEHKTMSRSALKMANELAKNGKQVSMIFETMLVHGIYGQSLYDEARKNGVRLIRFNAKDKPQIAIEGEKLLIEVNESTLPTIKLEIESDLLIVPNKVEPKADAAYLAGILRQSLDSEGHMQSANVRHRLINSPRKGIYFVGSCHDEIDMADFELECMLLVYSLLKPPTVKTNHTPEINDKKCARCLTCYRLCAHAAITLRDDKQPIVLPDICIGCGLCASCCPAGAIDFEDAPLAENTADKTLIFACERSAALAIEKAQALGIEAGENTEIITVSCAGSMGVEQMLSPLLNGANKVVVAGCHDGNCRSLQGSSVAASRTESAIKNTGLSKGELSFHPIAANQPMRIKQLFESLAKDGKEVQHD